MQNQLNPQYLQHSYTQAQPQTMPYQASPQASAVNIQIFNPTAQASPQGFYATKPCAPYPCNYNNAFIPQQQAPVNPTQSQGAPVNPSMYQTMNLNGNQNGVAAQGDGKEGVKSEKKDDEKKAKPKVALTDDYIRTLENYLNSGDKKIRLMGAKELFDRFKEDETRKDDAALTALLNKTLQDPADTVKFLALTALDTGYAVGNDETAQILGQIQQSDSSYGEDAALASQILLKMSGHKANTEAEKLNAQNNPSLAQTDLNNNAQIEPQLQEAPKPAQNGGNVQENIQNGQNDIQYQNTALNQNSNLQNQGQNVPNLSQTVNINPQQ